MRFYQTYRQLSRLQLIGIQVSKIQQQQRTMSTKQRLVRPAFFVCDLQERFAKPIYKFPAIVATTKKLLAAADILQIPVYATTQNKRALGDTVAELPLPSNAEIHDKSLFSMCIPEILAKLEEKSTVTIVGIESHICVLQTTLDLLENGHKVYVIRDGVSSCNPQEIPIAMARMQQAGAIITTSESWLFEMVVDSARKEFKPISSLVKETKQATKASLEALIGPSESEGGGGISKL